MWADIQVAKTGYTAAIYCDSGQFVDEHSATGNPHDSNAPGESIDVVTQWAVKAAVELLEKYGETNLKIQVLINETR